MSNIQTFLEKILSARYGKDVRQSIHDAIEEVDKVADTAQGSATRSAQTAANYMTSAKEYMESAKASAESAQKSAEEAATFSPDEYDALVESVNDHLASTSNPHKVTKSQVGLGNVDNKSSATIRNEITNANVTTALGYTPAELDGNGKIITSQLPSYVDDVIEGTLSTFPATGETGKIYVDTSTNKTYRWSGSAYAEISASLALGETSSTAYRGDRGKTAYEHSLKTSGNPHGVTKSDVGLGNVPNVETNNQTPTYTQATTLQNLVSGEKLSVSFGKIMKAIEDLISHLANTTLHITSTERTKWNGYESSITTLNSDLSYSGNKFSTVTKANGLITSDTVGILEKYGRIVHLSFSIHIGNADIATMTPVLTLPSGYKPSSDFYFGGIRSGYGTAIGFNINYEGKIVTVNNNLLANSYYVGDITFIIKK